MLPVLYQFGLLDPWPAWAVYATPPRSVLYFRAEVASTEFDEWRVSHVESSLATQVNSDESIIAELTFFDGFGYTSGGWHSHVEYWSIEPEIWARRRLAISVVPARRVLIGACMDAALRMRKISAESCLIRYGPPHESIYISAVKTDRELRSTLFTEELYLNGIARRRSSVLASQNRVR
ncbi:hypothetical protein Pan189_40790 [Stratiformator vulcanicus]|uniref:Uncharacterized protein n=1 Tax=Stratiformator vulcanicus TaxID=2527980 RepID=A0A517R717_9PLAN|nr:hypothetical protein Pan189_40790 [Stratiformator vulcanicus]